MNRGTHHFIHAKGMSLVELLVAIAVLMLVFGGLMGSFQFLASLIGSSKAQAGGIALANQRMEYLRSLPYDDVGTISGIPSGSIPPNSTTTLNGIEYVERVLIGYIDAPEDGVGASDINAIVSDYKLVKVEYSWDYKGNAKTISLLSNIVPQGIETTAGGGTLTVNVFDADVQPVSGAAVRVYNDTDTPTIDTTRYTNTDGVAMFSGAPALAGYEIFVSKAGFSSSQTYVADASNPNPTTLPVAVLEAEVSTMNFQIDELSDLTVETIGEPSLDEFEDPFDDSSLVYSSTDTAVAAGEATLAGAPGSYSASGSLVSAAAAPVSFETWNTAFFDARIPANTALVMKVYDMTTGTPSLVPDTDLPGNSIGFAPGALDLSPLDASTYLALSLGAEFSSSDTATTSALLEWSLSYTLSRPAIASVPFTLTSNKLIGSTASATPIYKYENSFVTDGTGDVSINDLEWDVYDVAITDASYDVQEACRNIPYSLDPGVDETLTLTLVPASAHSFRVRVEDGSGASLPNADATLSRSGFNETEETTACGQAFFSALSTASDYSLLIEAPGYTDQTISNIEISGPDSVVVVMVDA